MRLSVIGCGYLGTVHAAAMASLGHDVVGVDHDPARVRELAAGRAPFFEPGLQQLLTDTLATGRLRFSSDIADAGSAQLHFLCVGTPSAADGASAELRFLRSAVASLLPLLKAGDFVVGKSTVPVGTASELAAQISAAGATLAWNPEFLREGHAIADTLHPDRIVVGVEDTVGGVLAAEALHDIYAPCIAAGAPIIVTDLATAELAKGAANAFLATKISFMNMMADIADAAGADVTGLANILGHDPRIGSRYLGAGIGYGGGCLPKDLRAFVARAEELGAEAEILRQVNLVNARRRTTAAERLVELLDGAVEGRRVAVLGAAFKPDSDDVRDSPALDIASQLSSLGAQVVVTDPSAIENARAKAPRLEYTGSWKEALRGAEAVLLATDWSEYKSIDPERAASLVARPLIVDGRNCLDWEAWIAAGWQYTGIGVRGPFATAHGQFE